MSAHPSQLTAHPSQLTATDRSILQSRRSLLIGTLLFTALAALLRLYRLDQIPFGLHLDETYNSLDAYSLTQIPFWRWPLFFTSNFGREPLHIYLASIAQSILGPTHLAVRIVPALVSVALTPALIWLAWEMAPWLLVHRRIHFALWTGAASLTLLWAQMHARIFVRGGLFLLLEVLILAAFWRAWQGEPVAEDKPTAPAPDLRSSILHRQSLPWWILLGFLTGLSVYTYLPARLLPGVFLLFVPLLLGHHRMAWQRNGRGMLLAVGVALITAAPILRYFWGHPEDFLMRSGQVSVFSEEAAVDAWTQIAGVLGMAFVRGDFNLRMNVPLRPVLDIFTVIPFLFGVGRVLWNLRRPAYFSLLSLAGIMLLPTLLSLDTPNFGRAIGALPFFVVCIGLGLDWLTVQAGRLGDRLSASITDLGYMLLLAATILTWRVYFVEWAGLPELFHLWDEGYTRLGDQIADLPPDARVYISPQGLDHPTTRYLLLEGRDEEVQGFDGRVCIRVATDVPASYYFVFDDWFRGKGLVQSYLPDSIESDVVADSAGNVWAKRVDQAPGGAVQFPEQIEYTVEMADGIALQGYWLSAQTLTPGERFYVRLFWHVSDRPGHAYTAFAHLLLIDGNTVTQLAGQDRPPGEGSCPTGEWLAGEVVVDELQFVVPESLADGTGQYYLELGFYNPQDGQRLHVPDAAADSILIGPLDASP